MSFALAIVDEAGTRRVLDKDAPWELGGGAGTDIVLPGLPDKALALIGCQEQDCFIQPTAPEAGIHKNGRPVGTSVWIEDGDRLVIGGYRILCRMEDHCLCLELLGKAAVEPSGNRITVADDGGVSSRRAADYRPRVNNGPAPRAHRGLRFGIYAGLSALLLVMGFVLLAVPVDVTVTPAPDRMEIAGFPPIVSVAGQRLAVPGDYTVTASREGFLPLESVISVSGDVRAFTFGMEKLPGLLYLHVTPPESEAWVSLDGQTLGRAPLEGHEIPAGDHELEITSERYLSLTHGLSVEGMGQEERLTFTLRQAWADVSIRSEPDGARIFLDDEEVGLTPLTLEVLKGPHEIRLEKADHAPYIVELAVEPATERTIGPIELVALPGRLELSSVPNGAIFTLGNHFLGRGPAEALVEPGRSHVIKAMLPGYKDIETTVRLKPDERREISLGLEPEYGTVFVRATPPDATLEINGTPDGRAVQRLRLQTRAQRIRVVKEGYAPFETTVIPKADVSSEIAVTLHPLTELERLGLSRTIVTAARQKMLLLGPGTFIMGAPRREPGRRANEREQDVALTRRFYIAQKPVTNAEFRQFRQQHSSGTEGRQTLNMDNQPVVGISWEDAVRYLNWLSRQDGLEPAYEENGDALALKRPVGTGYRLPTEAEWAWAARMAGRDQRAKFAWGDGYPPAAKVGNYADESARGSVPVIIEGYNDGYPATSEVGAFPANPGGIFDMGSNVAEWTNDNYDIVPPTGRVIENPLGPESGGYRVVRGAGWRSATIQRLRLSFRDYSSEPRPDIGFRIARYAQEP